MDILILLVGSNPLPNYVVGSYLMNKKRKDKEKMPVPDTIILVHSDKTKIFAEKLNYEFKKLADIQYIDLKNKENDPECIKNKLINFLKSKNNISSLHLNFTGGKKTMAVYSYMAVYDYAKEKAIFSYLDPDKHRLVLQDGRHFPAMHDLRDDVLLNIQTVLELHDMKIINEGEDEPLYKKIISDSQFDEFIKMAVEKYYNNDRSWFTKFASFRNQFIRGASLSIREKWRKKECDPQVIESANKKGFFAGFTLKFPFFNNFFINDQYDISKADKFFTFHEFITGKWLEDFVLVTLQKLKQKGNIEVEEIKKGVEAHYADRKTEIDVIVIKGYEMFLISCTTSQEISFVKQKAFEALYRAEQVGGEHAKVVVVSLMYFKPTAIPFTQENNLVQLKKDLSQFDAAKNAGENLIGIDEIKKEVGLIPSGLSLSERLTKIIEG